MSALEARERRFRGVEQDVDSVPADGESSIELTATVEHDGDPLADADVEISHDGQDITLDPDQITQTTDGDGQVIWNVSSETVQSGVEFTFTVEDDYDQTATDFVTKDFTELPVCPFYGTTMGNPTQIHGIRGDPDDGVSTVVVGDLGDLSPDDIARPNGLAFDADDEVWYFADDHPDEGDGVLYKMTATEDGAVDELVEYENITGDEGEGIAGAAFWDATGQYLFIEEGGSQLLAATVDVGDDESPAVDVVESDLLTSDIGLGDLAIDRDNEMLYISTASSADGQIFFSVNLTDTSEQEIIADEGDGTDLTHAINKQIAFEEREVGDDVLWAHHAWEGYWWTVDLETGEHVQEDPITQTPTVDSDHEDYPAGYSDLARCGFADVDGLREDD